MKVIIFLGVILPTIAGTTLALQLAAEGRAWVEKGFWAVLTFSFFVAFLLCMGWSLLKGINPFTDLKNIPVAMMLGGPARLLFAICMSYTVVGIDKTEKFGLAVAAQIVVGLTLDHFGLFGMAVSKITFLKMTGAILMITGVFLVCKR